MRHNLNVIRYCIGNMCNLCKYGVMCVNLQIPKINLTPLFKINCNGRSEVCVAHERIELQ